MSPKIINLHKDRKALKEWGTLYIGRSFKSDYHFGNPFSHIDKAKNKIKVSSREEAIEHFRAWMEEEKYLNIEPDRRHWIWNNLWRVLQAKQLACYCHPLPCHGQILIELAIHQKKHSR
jgi:hypothetical protein